MLIKVDLGFIIGYFYVFERLQKRHYNTDQVSSYCFQYSWNFS